MSVTSIASRHPGVQALAAANEKSPILFPVAFRPLKMNGRENGAEAAIGTHKAVARMLDDKPMCLGIVGKDYGLVKNIDVLRRVETELLKHIPADKWAGVEIKDSASYAGAWTQREYLFRGLRSLVTTESGFETRAALSFLFRNSYDGGSSVFLGGKLVDLICINGAISVRWQENVSKRHTGAAPDYPYGKVVAEIISRYQREVAEMNRLGHHSLQGRDDAVAEFLAAHFSARRAERLVEQYRLEQHFRGANAFALMSALTYYGSHDSDRFAVRHTGNDNVAASIAKREDEVGELLHSKAWTDFLAA